MIFPPEMLDALQEAVISTWEGTVYRHMFGAYPPARSSTTGWRWNPAMVEAIYTSCEPETALAEAEYYIAQQPTRPRAKRMLYTIRVSLNRVVDLRASGLLPKLGITPDLLSSTDFSACQTIGRAVRWLGHEGLLVPSARRDSGTNLVIFQQDLSTADFDVVQEEVIAPDERS
jgi:RES domain-containing protein